MNSFVGSLLDGMLVLAQAPAGAKPAPDAFTMFLQSPLNLMLIIFMLFFFLVLWPQQRQQRAQQRAMAEALANMKKNDRVMTSSGIYGTVIQASADSPVVILRIDESTGAKMTVNRDSIARFLATESKADKES